MFLNNLGEFCEGIFLTIMIYRALLTVILLYLIISRNAPNKMPWSQIVPPGNSKGTIAEVDELFFRQLATEHAGVYISDWAT